MRRLGSKKNILVLGASVLGVIVVAFLTALAIIKASALNEKERAQLDDFSTHALLYLDEYDIEDEDSKPDETARLIAYAVAYNFGENNKTETTVDEVKQIAADVFGKEIDESKIFEASMNGYVQNKNIIYRESKDSFSLDLSFVTKDKIAITPLYLYREKKARSTGGKTIVRYEKYKIKSPYSLLNYSAINEGEDAGIEAYLNGEGSYASLKRSAKGEGIDSLGEYVKDIKIVYKNYDGSLHVDTVE